MNQVPASEAKVDQVIRFTPIAGRRRVTIRVAITRHLTEAHILYGTRCQVNADGTLSYSFGGNLQSYFITPDTPVEILVHLVDNR